MKYLGKFTLSVVSIALYIFALSTLYTWFAIPAGAPLIGTANIYGLAMIVSYITIKNTDLQQAHEKGKLSNTNVAGLRIVMSLFVLLIGYITTLFM
jgi:hypothetical protein